MKVKIESSTIVKPLYDLNGSASTPAYIRLSPFDKVTYDIHMGAIYVYRSMVVPPNGTLKLALQRVLTIYPEWAGRLGKNDEGEAVIVLNDQGVSFVEASVDVGLDHALNLLDPSPDLLSLHPPAEGVEELLQVQITRFGCGSVVVGYTGHHHVADGLGMADFFVAWGRVCRGLDIETYANSNNHDRVLYFTPRDPPEIGFDHWGTEYLSSAMLKDQIARSSDYVSSMSGDIVVPRVHFSVDFLKKLKVRARPAGVYYSTFVCVMAHLWRAITMARSLTADETTYMKISVNGRRRIKPRVPSHYFGNLVLWAFPKANVKDLVRKPLSHAAKLVHDSIAKIDEGYFRSFIDFSATELKLHEPDAFPTTDDLRTVICPDVDVDSLVRAPFGDTDFGGGGPDLVVPMYYPVEGHIFVLSSIVGDGSVDAFPAVSKDQLNSVMRHCYVLDQGRL